MKTKPTSEKVLSKIIHRGRGSVFFSSEFLSIGKPEAVRQTLSRLTKSGTIQRIGSSLYYYPAINDKLGGKLPPSANTVAEAIAKRTNSKIMPTGALAANLLGLSTQVPAKRTYLTDGPSRNMPVGSYMFSFRHVSPRRMAVKNHISSLVFEALRFFKRENIAETMVPRLQESLPNKAKSQLVRDSRYAPFWMRALLDQIATGRP
ncbi:MAG TPA: DUF6088 family protein [Elusimicrobiales bacterium]|nr:DUF6088 family protein [Elusimicrobiales bacterium]